MYKTSFVISLLLVFTYARCVDGQTDFFWSTYELNSGATNSDASEFFDQGSSGSLFLYFSTDGENDTDMSVGAFLDIATSANGVIEFTRAETFDFAVTDNGNHLVNRWLDSQGNGGSAGETGAVTANFINELNAFTVTGGSGILEAHNGSGDRFDEGYDLDANAFLFGVVDFDVVGSPGSSVDLTVAIGDGFFHGVYGFKNPGSFGGATITVRGIPEPINGSLMFCLAGYVLLRRSRQNESRSVIESRENQQQ